jgi:RNA polymerase sigma factor (TIGR02999 family)
MCPDPPEDAGGASPAEASPASELVSALYQDLRRIARWQRGRLSGGLTLNTTALINEAYVRLSSGPSFLSRGHFLRAAAIAMHRVLVDRVREQMALKRRGSAMSVDVDSLSDEALLAEAPRILAVHEALERLGALNPRLVEVVDCRFYGGYTEAETAEALGRPLRTVQREWALARAWLKKELPEELS